MLHLCHQLHSEVSERLYKMLRVCLHYVALNYIAGASCVFCGRKYKILGECFVYIEEQCTHVLNIEHVEYIRAL